MTTTNVKCPTCNTNVPWIPANTFRPFCSDRCQRIDFGDWATESFKISGEPSFDDFEVADDDSVY